MKNKIIQDSTRTNARFQHISPRIEELKSKKEAVNVSSVHKLSGVSKYFLYENVEMRAVI